MSIVFSVHIVGNNEIAMNNLVYIFTKVQINNKISL